MGKWWWVVLVVLAVLIIFGVAQNRMAIDEAARDAADEGSNLGVTSNITKTVKDNLCPGGIPAFEGVNC